jgi:hypothetical protein
MNEIPEDFTQSVNEAVSAALRAASDGLVTLAQREQPRMFDCSPIDGAYHKGRKDAFLEASGLLKESSVEVIDFRPNDDQTGD